MSKKPYVKPQILVEEWKVWKITKSSNKYVKKGTIYEISNFGRAKINGQLQTEFRSNSSGYYGIGCGFIHRGVAELFVPNPENKPEVDHIDGNQHNNMATNLRWVTSSENKKNPITRKRNSDSHKGKIAWNKDRKLAWVALNGDQKQIKREELQKYLDAGWHRGRK